jgi:hypothetical protein
MRGRAVKSSGKPDGTGPRVTHLRTVAKRLVALIVVKPSAGCVS